MAATWHLLSDSLGPSCPAQHDAVAEHAVGHHSRYGSGSDLNCATILVQSSSCRDDSINESDYDSIANINVLGVSDHSDSFVLVLVSHYVHQDLL